MNTSNNVKEASEEEYCASCGIAELDEVHLKECDGCDLVSYCSDACQRDHRSEHETKCKKRAAELRDEILFRQPESHLGDCPICCLPLPLLLDKSAMMSCCSKRICDGCRYANQIREAEMRVIQFTCLFCRQPRPKTEEDAKQNLMKRAAVNDPDALTQMGCMCCDEGDYDSAFEYWTKAAKLGDAMAHYNISVMYRTGDGVEEDEKKEAYHLEEAAIRGHAYARHNLGVYEENNGRIDRAVNHYIIAANLGDDESLKALKECYRYGAVSKEDFAAALRAHYSAVSATKSPQRDAAAKYFV